MKLSIADDIICNDMVHHYNDDLLNSGQFIITNDKNIRIKIGLGCCLAVTFHISRLHLEGIIHPMLLTDKFNYSEKYTKKHFVDSGIKLFQKKLLKKV